LELPRDAPHFPDHLCEQKIHFQRQNSRFKATNALKSFADGADPDPTFVAVFVPSSVGHKSSTLLLPGLIYTSFIHRTTAIEKINEQEIQLDKRTNNTKTHERIKH